MIHWSKPDSITSNAWFEPAYLIVAAPIPKYRFQKHNIHGMEITFIEKCSPLNVRFIRSSKVKNVEMLCSWINRANTKCIFVHYKITSISFSLKQICKIWKSTDNMIFIENETSNRVDAQIM